MSAEHSFPGTDWTAVRAASRGSDALDRLLSAYLPVLKSYLSARFRLPAHELDDLLQGFVVDKIFTKALLGRADRNRGRFRVFLINALTRYVISEIRRRQARKRAPDFQAHSLSLLEQSDLDSLAAEVPRGLDQAFAKGVFNRAVERMRDECALRGRPDLWIIFQERLLHPLEHGGLRARANAPTSRQTTNLLTTAKRMFSRNFRAVVSEYMSNPGEIDEEVRELKTVLALG